MTDHDQPDDMPTGQAPWSHPMPPPLQQHSRSVRWQRWAVPVGTLVLGLAIGGAAVAGADPTESTEYLALEQELEETGSELDDAEHDATTARERAAKANDVLTDRIAELDQREADLVAREKEAAAAPAPPASSSSPSSAPAPRPAPAAPAPPPAAAPPPATQTQVSAGKQNAQRSARQYLNVMGFSRNGLINQLAQFDGYSTDDATWAADNISANWNEQAAKSARQYLDVMGFSRDGLVNQLVQFDKYTQAQAEYGVGQVGL